MRKGLLVASVAIVASIGAGIWWLRNRTPAVDAPPMLAQDMAIDPQARLLIESTWREAQSAPSNGAARLKLAMVYHANGFNDLAESAYRQALALNGKSARAWYHLARLLGERGDFDDAITCINQSIDIEAARAPSHWRRGFLLLDVNQVSEARESFVQAATIDPNDVAAQVGLARAAIARGEAESAAAMLEQLLQRTPPPPNAAYIRQLLGSALRKLGRISGAQSALARADGAGVTWPDDWVNELAAMRVGYAATLENSAALIVAGASPQAVRQLTDLVRSRPGDVTALNTLAQAHMAAGDLDAAIDTLRKALVHSPNHAPTLINLSLAFEQKSQMDQAMANAQAAVNSQPSLGPAHLQLGRLLVLQNQLNRANEELSTAVRLGVSDPQVRIMLGSVMLEQKAWDDAARVLQQAIEAAPDSASGHAALARARMEQGEAQQARALLDRARLLNPKEPTLPAAQARLNQLTSAGATP